MGKASSSKKVSRVARTGGGRTARGRGSWLWPSVLTVTVVLGTAGIVVSRAQNQADDSPPHMGDHWHAAYGFDICGQFQGDLPQPESLIGIHTHGDGVIHVEPQNAFDTGNGATFGRWVSGQPGLKVSATSIQLPGLKALKNGDKCGDKPAFVQTLVDGKRYTGDPKDIRIEQGQTITVAFVPRGTKLTPPPQAKEKIARADTGATERNQPGQVFNPAAEATATTAPATPGATTTAPGTPGATTTSAPAPPPQP
jgi:hypothetical protein